MGFPAPQGLSDQIAQSSATYDIQIDGLDRQAAPDAISRVKIDVTGDWRYDKTLLTYSRPRTPAALGVGYTVTAREISPTVEQLTNAPSPRRRTRHSPRFRTSPALVLKNLPFRITDGATSDYERALMLQNWFRTTFDYSLQTVGGNDNDALKHFLRDQSGYCEQFAATMALMARVLDIPARVSSGTRQVRQAADGVWQVTAHDAHAWPELWFEGIGWVRFEPTPGGGDGGSTPVYAPHSARECANRQAKPELWADQPSQGRRLVQSGRR